MDHPEWRGRWGSFYPKIPPKIEAMTMPRTTQQMMIMIFFCTREAGRKGLRAWDRLEVGRAFRGSGLLGERTEGWRVGGVIWGERDDLEWA